LANFFGLGLLITALALALFGSYGWAIIFGIVGALTLRYGWTAAGFIGIFTGFIILSFYSVVGGWTIGYMFKACAMQLNFNQVEQAHSVFIAFIDNPWWGIGMHLVFMALCVIILIKGIKAGIERWSIILMPMLVIILIALILRAVTLPGAVKGISFFLTPDFGKLSAQGILIAMGHAFFTLSLGMGVMITYGSYVAKDQNIFTATMSIIGIDTAVSLMAGLAVFPAVFAGGFNPAMGPGLAFEVLPTVFNAIPLGPMWAALFFLLLAIAALTSGISILEVVVAYLTDEWKMKRTAAVLWSGAAITLLGVLCAISVTGWQHIEWLHNIFVKVFNTQQGSFFDFMEYLSCNWLLPVGGFLCSVFVGWVWGTNKAVEEIRHGSRNFADVHLISLIAGLKDDPTHNNHKFHVLTLASVWGIFIRFITPVAVAITFMHTAGWIKF
jgi:NSS family neurotransmitter:Na+ symporter